MLPVSLKDAVERFLFEEAELLDGWKLADWEALLTDDAQYLVPPLATDAGETLNHDTTVPCWRLESSG
jgi:p-cumate 2,3-dioxygenase subunit beta